MNAKKWPTWTLALLTAVVASAETQPCSIEVWEGRQSELEEFLRTAEVVSSKKVGLGVTEPLRVTIQQNGQTRQAVWKPIRPGRYGGFWESYKSEVAAYEMDKILGLNMVPPTVTRDIERQNGSLQLWTENCKMLTDVQKQPIPWDPSIGYELSRTRTFDNLIANPERNSGNILVGHDLEAILIDHSRAFTNIKKLNLDPSKLPAQFDRRLVDKLEALEYETLEQSFKGFLSKEQVRAIIARRDALLEYLEKVLA
jgi:hypothetical protein